MICGNIAKVQLRCLENDESTYISRPDLLSLLQGPHLTQEEILDYSHVDDFEGMDDEIDGNNSRHPPMTDDESDESEIDLDNPYE